MQNINNNINLQLKFMNHNNKQSVWSFRFFSHHVNEVLTFLG